MGFAPISGSTASSPMTEEEMGGPPEDNAVCDSCGIFETTPVVTVGIVIGAIVVLAVVTFLFIWCCFPEVSKKIWGGGEEEEED